MKRPGIIIIFIVLFFAQCGLINNKKLKDDGQTAPVVKTQEQILADEKNRKDSIENAAMELAEKTAFGELIFGMEKEEAERVNEKRQVLGKFSYNFASSFNDENRLYKLKIKSDGAKAVQFDTNLKTRYQNLYQIIRTKYGEPSTSRKFPSIFDVKNNKKFRINHWEIGNKQINLGLQENGLNSFSSYCDIFDKNMNSAETLRKSNLKNKDVIEASEKF